MIQKTVEDELRAVTGLKQSPPEKVARAALEEIEESAWERLSDAAKEWCNAAGQAIEDAIRSNEAKAKIPDWYECDEETLEESKKLVLAGDPEEQPEQQDEEEQEEEPSEQEQEEDEDEEFIDEDEVEEDHEEEEDKESAEQAEEPAQADVDKENEVVAQVATDRKERAKARKTEMQTTHVNEGRAAKTTRRKEPLPPVKAKRAARARPVAVAPVPRGRNGANGGSKTALVAALLKRKNGVTRAEILKATGWPSVSVQAMAKASGLKIKKSKDKGRPTTYFGS